MDLNVYKRRLGATSSSEALVNASRNQVKALFKDSPLYKIITLDGIPKGVRVNFIKENERQLLLQPEDSTNKGAIAIIDGVSWLVKEIIPDLIYPKANLAFCNQIVKWTDSNGTHQYPAVAKGKGYKLEEEKDFVKVAEGDVVIQIPYNAVTSTIKETQRFIFGGRAYEVTGIDNITNVVGGFGYLDITLELTSIAETDDTTNTIADNTTDTSGWGGAW